MSQSQNQAECAQSILSNYCPMGEVSHGTHRAEDLIPSFTDALRFLLDECEEVPELRAAVGEASYGSALRTLTRAEGCLGSSLEILDDEETTELIEELMSALDAFAPEGVQFGSNEGDGACFGFWSIDDDENEPDVMPLTFAGDSAESLRKLTQELRAAFYELDNASAEFASITASTGWASYDEKRYAEDMASGRADVARAKIQDVARALSVALVAQNA